MKKDESYQEQKQEEILLKLMQKDMKDELEKRSINTEINIKNERVMEKRENIKTKILKKPRKLNISKELVLDQPQQNQDKYYI